MAVIVLKFIQESAAGLEQTVNESAAHKVLRNGQVLILREGKSYDLLGNPVK